jgi:hypothetical protein
MGTKLLSVLNCREANAGKEKFAGALEKIDGTAVAQVPVALIRGVMLLKEKLGTRGIQNASASAMLQRVANTDGMSVKRLEA